MKITFFVHGTTKDNEKNLASGWSQIPLSRKGREQTRVAARDINSDVYDGIFTSDLKRAIQSAKLLFFDRKEFITIDSRLRECNYGLFTNSSATSFCYLQYIDIPFTDGERLIDVEERMRSFLEEKKSQNYKNIAIVGHRAPQLALEVITKGLTWETAIKSDWREIGSWKLGWEYTYSKM